MKTRGNFDDAGREYRTALSTFETARSELKHEDSRLPFLSNATHIYDDYIHFSWLRVERQKPCRSRTTAAAALLPRAWACCRKQPHSTPTASNVQAVARRAGATILFYWLGEKQSYLWAVTPPKTRLFTLPPGPEIDATVQRYRRALAGPQDVLESADPDGRWLFQTLVGPTQDVLPKDAKVVVIPDGSLNNLNFETLLALRGRFRTEVRTTGSKTSALPMPARYASWAGRPSRNRKGIAVCFSSVKRRAKRQYPELAKAAAQMESVARHFPAAGEKILTREQATPSAYLASKSRTVFLHSFCRPRNSQPAQSARLGHCSVESQRRKRLLQALRPRHHSPSPASRTGHNLGLLQRRRAVLLGRGPGRALVGFPQSWKP